MRARGLAAITAGALIATSLVASGASGDSGRWGTGSPGPRGGEVHEHAQGGVSGGASSRAPKAASLLSYHGGPVMAAGAAVTAIYWGTQWTNPTFAGDKKTGLAAFYSGIGGSSYLNTNTEYTQTGGAFVLNSVTNSPALTDATAAPTSAPSTGAVLNEVAKALQAANQTPVSNGYYPVYSDQKRGKAGYCAWHSNGNIGSVNVQFAFFFNLDGDSGCNPGSTIVGTSQGLAAVANVSAHELSETMTDPALNAWWDSTTGYENSDKCAWTFSSTPPTFGGRQWKLQGNWSNAAYNANQGYTRGCIDTR